VFDFVFSPRRLVLASIFGLCFAVAFLAYGWIFVSYRYTTDFYLGQSTDGTAFEEPSISLSRMNSMLDLPAPELARINVADLKELVIVSLTGGRIVRIRSVGSPSDSSNLEAVHRYLTDRLSAVLTPLAQDNRRRMAVRIQEIEALVAAVTHDQGVGSNNLADVKRSEESLKKIKSDLREILTESRTPAGSSDSTPSSLDATLPRALLRFGVSNVLSSYESIDLLQLPSTRMNVEQEISKLQRSGITSQAELQRAQLDFSRWQAPSAPVVMARDGRPAGPGPISRLIFGFIVGLVLFVMWIWVRDRWARSPA
jgi:hypothetical protein